MPAYTVQCTYATYWSKTVVIKAETTEEASRLAVEKANDSDSWKALDDVGETFVDAIRLGEHDDAWSMDQGVAVPEAFTEAALFCRPPGESGS